MSASDGGMDALHCISVSGGKDSTATWLLALETVTRETIRPLFADTGNEHPLTYEYLDYLEKRLGMPIVRLRRSFETALARKREYVLSVWPEEGVPAAICERAAEILSRPTGIPFLDLCIWKGRMPALRAQFCTQFLKTEPLVSYQLDLADEGNAVWSWQGIRAEEGGRRAFAPGFEEVGGGLYINRPILRWTAADCFEAMAFMGVEPNPLYRLGMKRVGCMPCVNAAKNEVLEIAKRWPEVIDRIAEWEFLVGAAGKRDDPCSSFFPAPDDGRGELRGRDIRTYVQWSKTSRGGRQLDLLRALAPPQACSSSYGLCE